MPACRLVLAATQFVIVPTPARALASGADFILFDNLLRWIATGIEAAGILVIVAGGILATVTFLRQLAREHSFTAGYRHYRANLGRAILLGLEFLIAADIVGTVAVEATFENLGVLALIVLIRTFLSIALQMEIEGQWPWKSAKTGSQNVEPP